MGFKISENTQQRTSPCYTFGQTAFTIISAADSKTKTGNDMLKILCEVTDKDGKTGKFTACIFGDQSPIYQAFLASIGMPELFGKEVDGQTFEGCQGNLLMGWNAKTGYNCVDAWLPKERGDDGIQTYVRHNAAGKKSEPVSDDGVDLDDIPF